MKDGKLPLSEKGQPRVNQTVERNKLDIHPELIKYLKSEKLTYKFINGTRLAKDGGFHSLGYEVFSVPAELKPKLKGFGVSPDGRVVRGDLVLATLPEEDYAQLKAEQVQANQAVREALKSQGISQDK